MNILDAVKKELIAIHDALSDVDFYWRVGYYGLILAASVHASFIVLFFYLHIALLGWINIFSTLLYLYAILGLGLETLRTKDDRLIGWLVFVELLGHNLTASYLLSREAGFEFYIYMLVVLPFFVTSYRFRVYMARIGIAVASALWIDTASFFDAPKVTIDKTTLDILHHANLAIFLVTLAILAYLYAYHERHERLKLLDDTMKDVLTGIYNRRYIYEIIPAIQAHTYFVMLIDIDRFKQINDKYGHLFGDQVLIEVTRRIQSILPRTAILARWGGEEFVVIVKSHTMPMNVLAEQVMKVLREKPIACGDIPVYITATIGLSVRYVGESFEKALRRADTALYRGKESGRNQIRWEEL